jgi:hypothetical protein
VKTLILWRDPTSQWTSIIETGRYTERVVIEYDETAPCRLCGLPVGEASMGGTDVCPPCDCGVFRDGERWVETPVKWWGERQWSDFRELARRKGA